jgi:Putative Ig domain/Ricin-type beta-trefoil lectin domain/Subtilase family
MRLCWSARRAGGGVAPVVPAIAGLAIAGLLAVSVSPVSVSPASASTVLPAGAPAGLARVAPAAAGARFVAVPRVAAPIRGVRQVCPTPTRPGQMACMALVRTRAGGAIAAFSGPPSGAYSPAVLREAYGLSTAAAQTPPAAETVAVVDAYADSSAAADLAVYRSHYGLRACTTASGCLRIVGQAGGGAPHAQDPSGAWEAEQSLDLDMVSAICPECSILLVEANSDDISNLATAEQYATSHANAVSNSWGSGAEFTGERAYDPDFYRPGVAITAAAGDSGYGTQYPAASPFVTAVGGTSLRGATAASPGTQTAWSGTGAGCSALEPRPSWQTAPAGCENRTETDVSADADPFPGVAVYDSFSGGWITLGGTSVAAPIIASTYALADITASIADHRAHAGLVPGTFPAAYPYSRGGLADVVSGADGRCTPRYLCTAGPGYDGPTGLGTPAGTAGFTGQAASTATVLDPGTQVVMTGAPMRLPIRSLVSGSGGQRSGTAEAGGALEETVTFSAAGLPAGLTIDPRTGVISGHAPAAAGVRAVTVTLAGPGVTSGSATFRIVVLPVMSRSRPGAGPVRLGLGGKCLTDSRRGARSGARVVLGACARRRSQDWAYLPGSSPWSAGEVRIGGRCLSVLPGAAARVTLRACGGAAGQRWEYRARDHLWRPALAAPETAPRCACRAAARSRPSRGCCRPLRSRSASPGGAWPTRAPARPSAPGPRSRPAVPAQPSNGSSTRVARS